MSNPAPSSYTNPQTYDGINIHDRARASLGNRFSLNFPSIRSFRARHCYLVTILVFFLVAGIVLTAVLPSLLVGRDQISEAGLVTGAGL